MTRQEYILHLDHLRKGVIDLMDYNMDYVRRHGKLANPTILEEDRAKKTQKMFDDLVIRLYEDGAVSERVKQDKIAAGEFEQAEISFPDTFEEAEAEEAEAETKSRKRRAR